MGKVIPNIFQKFQTLIFFVMNNFMEKRNLTLSTLCNIVYKNSAGFHVYLSCHLSRHPIKNETSDHLCFIHSRLCILFFLKTRGTIILKFFKFGTQSGNDARRHLFPFAFYCFPLPFAAKRHLNSS